MGQADVKHDAFEGCGSKDFERMRVEAMNAPLQLAKQLVGILENYTLFGGDRLVLIDAAAMLSEIAEGYDG